MSLNTTEIMRLLQFTDSTFPVGTFSFSNGLETAGFEKIVHDARTLREFVESQALQAAFTDGIAALAAHRAYLADDYDSIIRADRTLMLCKMNDEARQMLQRMGKKLAELARRLFESEIVDHWLDDIRNGSAPGTYPVAQGITFAAAGIDEKDLFCSHQYGVVNMVLSAALRCVRVSHYDTQRILYDMSSRIESLYEEVKPLRVDEMHAFFPELDIIASLHEKGNMRMFMN
ncbi:MAG: urease accessory protein UreF [Muribaculaceae bacterium]|nr:urease accessory protein UreF [Muribaculaceae bacterium]MDE5924575.1 urease accessory protein UreF [Muribaculaceae bacterium]MDE6330234.1 urease accessory protein UreF [Muribaculaceae bacterium]